MNTVRSDEEEFSLLSSEIEGTKSSRNDPEKNCGLYRSNFSQTSAPQVNTHSGRVGLKLYNTFAIQSLSLLCILLYLAFNTLERFPGTIAPVAPTSHYPNPNELTDAVTWDNYSLIVKGQRVFIFGGEFHPFRLPVPDLWLDVLQKIKATGMNTISVYLHWGVTNPSPGIIDLDDWRSIQALLDAAKRAGLFVILRPGPYINAETSAGGIPHWVTSRVSGRLRTNASSYREAWEPYLQAVAQAIVPNQITTGGPIIAVQLDNEYTQSPASHAEYFEQLKHFYISNGVVVPLTYNDPNRGENFVNGTGAVDIYGLDSYPQRFDCAHPDTWMPLPSGLLEYHERVNPDQPFYFPEVQGGSFDGWGPFSPGYDACYALTNPEFIQVFNHHIWANNAKLMSVYMTYGGTSWGGLPFPGVYTSYDYGAAIRENRELSAKYHELKTQGFFLRSSPDFAKTDWVTDTLHVPSLTRSLSGLSVPEAFVTHIRNPDTRSSFYIARQANISSVDDVTFKMSVKCSAGDLLIPQTIDGITLAPRQSKILTTGYRFGASSKVIYSTASVFFAGVIGGRDVLFLHGPSNQAHEVGVSFTGFAKKSNQQSHPKVINSSSGAGYSIVTFLPGIKGLITVWDSPTQLILYADSKTTASFYAPVISYPSSSNSSSYWQFGSNDTMLIGGPYLVRNATLDDSILSLRGDLNGSVMLTLIGPRTIRGLTWNGVPVASDLQSSSGVISVPLVPRLRQQKLAHPPKLSGWKYANSLPEIESGYSDAHWTIANHTSSNISLENYYGDGRILYGCDYEFCENLVIYRGHFVGGIDTISATFTINGGAAFAASVWVNAHFIKSVHGSSVNNANPISEVEETFHFPDGMATVGRDNVITIVVDNMGLEEHEDDTEDAERSPRGIRGFRLNSRSFTDWKVQGKLGGYSKYPDKVRGILNEGGSFAERSGWHLPGFNTSQWETRSPSDGLPSPGLEMFVTTFDLDIDEGFDVPMSFVFDKGGHGQAYRAYLFVNGWFMGKRIGYLGPQSKFPVHEGILNYHGTNTVSLLIWSTEADVAVRPEIELVEDGFYDGGVGHIHVSNSPWDESRLLFVSI